MRTHIITLFYTIVCLAASAQQLTVQAPSQVPMGENFRVAYTINTSTSGEHLQIAPTPAGLDLMYGPAISMQESIRTVNGHTNASASTTYTYTYIANKTGTYTLPPAKLQIGGKTITSSAVRIRITPQQHPTPQQQRPRFFDEDEQRQRQQEARQSADATGKDLFIRVSANKQKVYEQEPIVLTYKVYTLVDLTELNGKMPDLKGFHVQEVQQPQQKTFHTETINGRTYRCVTWSQYVMYPQMTGTLEIPTITFKGVVVKRNRYVDPLEEFFNGGSGYTEQRRELQAPPISIQVEPLPKKPDNFSGAVGHFNISAQTDRQQLKTGQPFTVRVIVSGVGNMKLMKQPDIAFPKDFEHYDIKVTDKTKLTGNGAEGNMIYDCVAVPAHVGNYTIPPVAFCYYDTQTNGYRTLHTQPLHLTVEQGDGTVSVTDYSEDNDNDIHGLHGGKSRLIRQDGFFFLSAAYWISLALPILLFGVLLYMFRRRALLNANTIMARERKAEKVANRRLSRAGQLMQQGQANAFYDEVMRALWGYTGDKMHIPVEQLSRENIHETLRRHNIPEDTISAFITALDDCEYEQYAPGDTQGNMQHTYNTARQAIMQIENGIRTHKKRRRKRTDSLYTLLAIAVCAFAFCPAAHAVTKENADAEYAKGNYQQAIADYEQLLRQGVSADVYYNLGNAYYRTENITKALLNYERARLLSPGDADIRHNLQLAQTKTLDKIPAESEMFFITWMKALVNMMSVDRWAKTSLLLIAGALVMLLVYLFSERMLLRKVGFFGSICLVALFLLATTCAWMQQRQLTHRNTALIISNTAQIKRTPDDKSPNVFTLHEGTKVVITDKTLPEWSAIRIADGRKGWIENRHIETI